MEWIQFFTESYLKLINYLAWPAVVLVCFFVIRKPVLGLLQRVKKVGKGDLFVELAKEQPAFEQEPSPTKDDQDKFGLPEDYASKLSEQMVPDAKQIFLSMAEKDEPIEVDQPIYYRYVHGESDINWGGTLLSYLILQLNEAELVKYKGIAKNFVELTLLGKAFAKWLCEHDQKASYFESPQLTKWGEASENAERKFGKSFPEWQIYSSKQAVEEVKREMRNITGNKG